jgi:hypothetical protein
LIIDSHCHVIVEKMTAGPVPEQWRPAVHGQDLLAGLARYAGAGQVPLGLAGG